MSEKAPNILLIQADQMAAPALPFHGHPVVKAPHMSALAEAGVVFDSAYCNSPLCAPSRFSMLSGLMPSEIAAYDNAAEFPATVPTFVHHLRRLGYRTVLSGKMHFVGPDQLHGFERRVTTDIYPADFGWTPDWERPGERQDFYHTMLSVAEAGPCERSLQMDFDEEVAHQGVRALYDLAREGGAGARPFFLQVSFTHPHDPYTITQEYWDRYDDAEIDLPRVPAMAREALDPHSRRVFDACGMAEYDMTEARVRAARRAYYGAISYIDDQVGRLMAALKSACLDDDTIVILTGDHGDMLGERGLWYKMSFYEWSARVPLVVHAPARFGARRVARNVSLVDLYPTLIELGGGGRDPVLPGPLSGNSLVPLMTGQEEGWSDTVAGEYLGEAAAGPLVMIRRGPHKYIVGEDSPAQLFDLAADPDEMNDLAGDPKHGALAAAFAAEAAARWDFDALKRAVILNQRRRRFVFAAHRQGEAASWDFQPRFDASRLYARNRADILGDLEREARLPYAAAPPADGTGG